MTAVAAPPAPGAHADMNYVLGIDVGGTNLVAGCVAEDGSRLEGLLTEPTRAEEGADGVVDRLLSLASAFDGGAGGCGAGRHGRGRRRRLPRPARYGTRHRAADPESRLGGLSACGTGSPTGSASLRRSTTMRTAPCSVSTGAAPRAAPGRPSASRSAPASAAGIILDGKLYHGASDCAGEIGHTTIEMNGRRCACGNYGCLEAYASGPAIARRAIEAVERGAESSLRALLVADPLSITAQVVYEAAKAGDGLATEVVQDTARILGAAIANLVNVFNPEVVVVCGGVTLAGESLFAPLRREVTRRAFRPAVEVCRIVPGALTGSAGVYGAAALLPRQPRRLSDAARRGHRHDGLGHHSRS